MMVVVHQLAIAMNRRKGSLIINEAETKIKILSEHKSLTHTA